MSADEPTELVTEEAPLEMLEGVRLEDLGDYDLDAGLARFEATKASAAGSAAGSKLALWAALGLGSAGLVAAVLSLGNVERPEGPGTSPPAAVVEPEAPSNEHEDPRPAPEKAAEAPKGPTPVAPTIEDPAKPDEGLRESEPRPSNSTKRTKTKAKAPPATTQAGPSELELAAEMRSALSKDPARALALAEEGQRRFPKGMFSRERESHAVLALVALGRTKDAQKRGQRYLERYPTGAQSERIRAALNGL